MGLGVLGQLQFSFLQVALLCLGAYEEGLTAVAFPLQVLPLEILSASPPLTFSLKSKVVYLEVSFLSPQTTSSKWCPAISNERQNKK